jgi:protein phosphatase
MNQPLATACLIVLVGPPGSGKSTWARHNGCGAVHISQDDLIDAITPDGFEHVYRSIYAAAEEAIARAALQAGHTVIVDRTNRTEAHRRRWIGLAREARCPAVAVEMNTPHWLCRERNNARQDHRRVSEPRLERMFAAMETVCPEEGFSAIYTGDAATLAGILLNLKSEQEVVPYEHCHQAR